MLHLYPEGASMDGSFERNGLLDTSTICTISSIEYWCSKLSKRHTLYAYTVYKSILSRIFKLTKSGK